MSSDPNQSAPLHPTWNLRDRARFRPKTHAIALVAASNRGYTDEGEAGKAHSFDLKTFAVQKHMQSSEGAVAITFDPVSNHVFIINGDGGSITVIDPRTDAVVATFCRND